MMSGRVLIVDTDKSFVKGLRYSLEQDEYVIDHAGSAAAAMELLNRKNYDMVLTEIELPDSNGLLFCQNLRTISAVPLIFITIVDEDIKKILALEYGADDYLVKPFNILELKARIKAVLRRYSNKIQESDGNVIEIRDIRINTVGRKVTCKDKNISLTGKEFDLLYVLASTPGKVYTREELLERVWGYAYYGDLRTVDVHIRRIREKLEKDPKSSEYIITKWGVGYFFREK